MNPIREAAIQYIEKTYGMTGEDGRPVVVEEVIEVRPATYDGWHLHTQAKMSDGVIYYGGIHVGHLIANVITGD